MAIVIQPYRPEHEPAVADFNQRLRQAGEDENLVFYRWAQPRWLPRTAESRIYNEFFVAVDGGIVRGGYALKSQEFFFPGGEIRSIGYYHHPLSEGIVNKAHAMVGALLLRDAMQRAPLLYCLGMGGYDRPLPQMLVRLGWTNCLMPSFFRVVNASRFLRNMQILRSSPSRKFVMDLAAHTGIGWAARRCSRRTALCERPGRMKPSAAKSRALKAVTARACSLSGNRRGRLARSRRCAMPRLCALCILRPKRISRALS